MKNKPNSQKRSKIRALIRGWEVGHKICNRLPSLDRNSLCKYEPQPGRCAPKKKKGCARCYMRQISNRKQ